MTLTYDGFLKTQSAVNVHWGINGWQNVTTTAMTKSGEIWTATLSVPGTATVLNMAFNNGSGTWDNNSSADYSKSVGASGGTTPPPPGVFAFNPNPPVAGQTVTLTYDGFLKTQSAVNLHWGRNGWQDVITTAMTKVSGVWTLTFTIPPGTTVLNFVFNNGSGGWDNNGGQDYQAAVSLTTDIPDDDNRMTTRLFPNYPNPFNPSTVISWQLANAGRTRLAVYDLLGREVAVLADGVYPVGGHSVRFDADGLPSGVYVYRLTADGTTLAGRMLFLK